VQEIHNYYDRIGHPKQYEHAREVVQLAKKVGIIETDIIGKRGEDPKREWANVFLFDQGYGHPLDNDKLRTTKVRLPAAFDNEYFQYNNDIFAKLTALERIGATPSEFEKLLNGGQKPLALLIKLPDFAVTHDGEDKLEGFIANGKESVIRQYASMEEARLAMKMDAIVGEKYYGPIAELFGYPLLAGNIFLHSFRVNHPEIYNHILTTMNDPLMKERMAKTQHLVLELSKVLNSVMKSYGFEAEVQMRREKHDGKKMRKMLATIQDDYRKSEYSQTMSTEEYIKRSISSFDFERFNDWVAVRVVLHRFRGRSMNELISEVPEAVENGTENGRGRGVDLAQVGQLLDSIKVAPLRLAVKCVSDTITSLGGLFGDVLGNSVSDAVYYEKKNGYRAFHFDTRPVKSGPNSVLPFEVQLKTPEWHNIAENGLAAHYYYIGGDNQFVDMIRGAYNDIIHPPEPKSRPNNGAPPSRRSSPSIPPVMERKEPASGKTE
jgi:hypothetical protein